MANYKECPGHSSCGLVSVLQKKLGFTESDRGLIDCGTNPLICPRISPIFPKTIPIENGPTTTREVSIVSGKNQTEKTQV